jgi:hypothetical protein
VEYTAFRYILEAENRNETPGQRLSTPMYRDWSKDYDDPEKSQEAHKMRMAWDKDYKKSFEERAESENTDKSPSPLTSGQKNAKNLVGGKNIQKAPSSLCFIL